jgi:hypothetical protein
MKIACIGSERLLENTLTDNGILLLFAERKFIGMKE